MGLSALVTCCLAGSGDGAPSLLNRLALCITINEEEEARYILDGDHGGQLATVFLGGNTVLHLAAKSNAMEILQTALRLLRSPGAAAHLSAVGASTGAVHPSSHGTHDADQAYFHGFLNRPNSSGMTALMVAAKIGHDGVVLALLEAVSTQMGAWEAQPVAFSPTQRMQAIAHVQHFCMHACKGGAREHRHRGLTLRAPCIRPGSAWRPPPPALAGSGHP